MSRDETNETTTQIIQSPSMPEFDINENYKLWHERLELRFVEIGCKSESGKVSTLSKTIGSEAYGILHSICSPELPSSKTYNELNAILNQHFTPPVIVFYERNNFYTAKRSETDTVASWYAKVKKLALNLQIWRGT